MAGLIDSLFSDSSKTVLQDKCIFHLMLDCSLRSRKIICLKVSDLMFDKNVFSVFEKGSKYRLVIMPPSIKSVLFKYLVFYQEYRPGFSDASSTFVQLIKDKKPLTDVYKIVLLKSQKYFSITLKLLLKNERKCLDAVNF